MRDYCRRVGGNVIVISIGNRGADGMLIIGSIRNREFRQSGDADGRRLNERSDGRFGN